VILSGAMRVVLEEREVDLVEEGKETAAVTAAAMVVMMMRLKKEEVKRRGEKRAKFY
jgi:hypothetical protein